MQNNSENSRSDTNVAAIRLLATIKQRRAPPCVNRLPSGAATRERLPCLSAPQRISWRLSHVCFLRDARTVHRGDLGLLSR
jgi:hypothetical protein